MPQPVEDVLAFEDGDERELERAAARAFADVLYAKSPGGIVASAERTAAFRGDVEKAVRGSDVDADLLEAIVLLESAGRPDVIAGADPAAASGLTQILAETAVNFLGMRVDLEQSRRLTRRLARAEERGDERAARRLRVRRRAIDERFDPPRALAATVRYLETARERLGRDDLAVVSYHMGIGNVTSVLRDYGGDPRGLSYARVYFDSSPTSHAAAWRRLISLGDDSETYYWRVLAAREIMRVFRDDRDRLGELLVVHRPDEIEPLDVETALEEHVLQPVPNRPRELGFRHADPTPALRPEPLALLLYLADRVRDLSGAERPLVVTRLADPAASHAHAAGWSFDVRRRYASGAQAQAFQHLLDRLHARGLIAWTRSLAAIHVTVAPAARALVKPLLRPIGG